MGVSGQLDTLHMTGVSGVILTSLLDNELFLLPICPFDSVKPDDVAILQVRPDNLGIVSSSR